MEIRDYARYCHEMSEIARDECSETAIWQSYIDYTTDKRYEIKPISDREGKEVGFLIIGKDVRPESHFDYYIAETYIKPKYRKHGYTFKAVKEFIETHKGSYTLFIINNNTVAKHFWRKVQNELNLKPIYPLTPCFDDETCTEYGFYT